MAANESGVAAVANKLTYGGASVAAGSGAYGWLAENHYLISSTGILVGIGVALYGAYLQTQKNRRGRIEHEARMKQMLRGDDG